MANNPEFKSFQKQWSGFLSYYRNQAWGEAQKSIDVCRCDSEKFDFAAVLHTYQDRVQRLEKSPPPCDWDGVFTAETK